MPTSCGTCGGFALSYEPDGSAKCAACGALTPPVWGRLATQTPPSFAASPGAPVVATPAANPPPLRFVNPPPIAPTAAEPGPASPTFVAHRAPKVGMGGTHSLRQQRIIAGVVLLVIGVLVTVGTYALAASNPGSGTYFIAFGPVIAGVYVIVKGLGTPASLMAPTRRARPRAATAAPYVTQPSSPATVNLGSPPAMLHRRNWPLILFLIGGVLILAGLAVTPLDYNVGASFGEPGLLILFIAPLCWVAVKVSRRLRKGPVCSACGQSYPQDYRLCPKDGTPLQPSR